MKRRHGFGLIAAVAVAVCAGAQASAFQQDQDQMAGSKDKDKTEIVVTGCLSPASSTATGTAGTSGSATSASPSGKFMLTNATIGTEGATAGTTGTTPPTTSATPPTSTTPPTASTAETAGAGTSYVLSGGNQSDFQKWLNARVEIHGRLEPARSSGSAQNPPESMNSSSAKTQTLRVTSARKVSDTCSQ